MVAAFYEAAREGDFERLLAVLDPEVALRIEDAAVPAASRLVRGARAVAQGASSGAQAGRQAGRQVRMALVNGAAGGVIVEGDQLVAVMSFTVVRGRIAEIEVLTDRNRLRSLSRSRR